MPLSQIALLLSTYNGQTYLDPLLESLVAQTFEDWHLYIRDDGSNDATFSLLEKWQKKYPEKITLLPKDANKGIIESYNILFSLCQEPWIAFVDQDDVWKQNKLEVLVRSSEPMALIHSDLVVVDAKLSLISSSFWRYMKLRHTSQHLRFHRLLTQSLVTACATLVHRPLADKAFPIPKEAIMHDWWLSLVAASFGKIISIDEPLIYYRQHSNNTVGAKRVRTLDAYIKNEVRKVEQAKAFEKRFPNKEPSVAPFVALNTLAPLARMRSIVKNDFFKIGLLRNLFHLCGTPCLKKR